MTEALYREAWKHFSDEAIKNTKKIQELNDRLRKLPARTQDMVVCMGALANENVLFQALVAAAARDFDAFTESNDPHGEHDCATFEVQGTKFMFKIDYYDLDLKFGSDEPWRPEITRRVMTLMYAEDY